jgi:transposase-like protein
MDLVALVRAHLEEQSPDVLRVLVKTFAEAVMSAEAQVLCGAEYGEVSPDRSNLRNGYHAWEFNSSLVGPSRSC